MSTSQMTALEEKFPRITSAITLLWGNPEMDTYFSRITVDDRGDREGFPPEVMSDILFLATLHSDAYPFGQKQAEYANRGMRIGTPLAFR
jgi:hypothetical protein